MHTTAIVGAAIACAAANPAVATTLIDFEGLNGVLDDQFRDVVAPGLGVDFNGTLEAAFSATAHSGSLVAVAVDDPAKKGGDPVRIDAVGSEFLSLSVFWTSLKTAAIEFEAFSATDDLLFSIEAVTAKTGGKLISFELDQNGLVPFAYVVITGMRSGHELDDFQFELAATAIPLPGGAALGLAGLSVVCVRRRRGLPAA